MSTAALVISLCLALKYALRFRNQKTATFTSFELGSKMVLGQLEQSSEGSALLKTLVQELKPGSKMKLSKNDTIALDAKTRNW